jgi:hypothetical protein
MPQRRDRRGATLVLVALSMTVVLGFAAFAADLSQMAAYRSELQRAADAGAHAGAIQLTKTNYDSAAAIATSYAAANLVFGRAPIVDAIEYGSWNNVTSTFTLICSGLTCGSASVKAADAMRIVIHGNGSTIFAGILGAFGFSVQTTAVAWAAPTVTNTNCLKPLAIPYSALTKALNGVLRLPADFDTLRYPLTVADLDVLRENPTALGVCLKASLLTSCNLAEAAGLVPSLFQTLRLGVGPIDFDGDLATGCLSAGPGDVLTIDAVILNLASLLNGSISPDYLEWCANFGTDQCAIKVALYEGSALNPTITVKSIASFVITGTSGNLTGYFSDAIDTGPIDPLAAPGMLYRPVLAQ